MNIYFKNDEKGKLTRVCNVQCLSAAVYKKIIKKITKSAIHMSSFFPHSKSLDGISKLSVEELIRLGFNDVNTARRYRRNEKCLIQRSRKKILKK